MITATEVLGTLSIICGSICVILAAIVIIATAPPKAVKPSETPTLDTDAEHINNDLNKDKIA